MTHPPTSRNLGSVAGLGARAWRSRVAAILLGVCGLLLAGTGATALADGVFVRFTLLKPADTPYSVALHGYIHRDPWYLPATVWPAAADKDPAKRCAAGTATPWFDVKDWAGKRLHGRTQRSGGIAEFPNVTVTVVTDKDKPAEQLLIELATAPDAATVVKSFTETLDKGMTSFLVSPDLARDKDSLESLSQMETRHLQWAREATGGTRVAPKELLIQTSFYGARLKGAEVLSLLGFNTVGGQTPETQAKFPELRVPGHTHDVDFGPAATQEEIDALMKKHAAQNKNLTTPGLPFGFADEICCRPEIGKNAKSLEHFRSWLGEHNIAPQALGVTQLSEVLPIENPTDLQARQKNDAAAANRVFYYTSRFRQEAGTQRIRWTTEAFHKYFAPGLLTSTLVADHPYFSGTGLGMGMTPNTAWGGAPLALDWFDLARNHAVDLAGIEDWMGLQYMYGPHYTWEGFQLMGFQAAMFRSGSRGTLPIIAWITPSDETNLRLKCASALAQGAKHFFFWTYGPTAFGTENYWSDLRGEYDGIAKIARQLAAAEHIIAPGVPRKARVALLYSISSDLWQPFGYIHMLERRGLYLSLVHDQYLVDMLTEEDLASGRLADYDVLYTADPCISERAVAAIAKWVEAGGYLFGTCAAGTRNEFNEPVPGLAPVFGIDPTINVKVQPGEYRVRGNLNGLAFLDQVQIAAGDLLADPATWRDLEIKVQIAAGNQVADSATFGALGIKAVVKPAAGVTVIGTYADKSSAVVIKNRMGRGQAVWVGTCPGLSYIKDARFVPAELKEQWPLLQRRVINGLAARRGVTRLVTLSQPVVEAGVFDAPGGGSALVLANFTYNPIPDLTVHLPLRTPVKSVRSSECGELKFALEPAPAPYPAQGFPQQVIFTLKLGLNDIIVAE